MGILNNEENNKATIKGNLLYAVVSRDSANNNFHIHVYVCDKTGNRTRNNW